MTKVGPCLVYLTRICHTIVILCHTAHLKQEAYSPVYLSRMSYLTSQVAPRLPPSKLHIIRDMIESQSLGTSELAEEAECNQATIINIRANLRRKCSRTSSIRRAVLAKGWSKKKKKTLGSKRESEYRFARMVFA